MEFETVVKVYVGEKEDELDVFGELSDRLNEQGPYQALKRETGVQPDAFVFWRMVGVADSAADHAATAARQVEGLLMAHGVEARVLDLQTGPRQLKQEELAQLGAPRFRITCELRSETPKPDVRLLEELLASFPATDAATPRISGNGGVEIVLEVCARDRHEASWLVHKALDAGMNGIGGKFSDAMGRSSVEALAPEDSFEIRGLRRT